MKVHVCAVINLYLQKEINDVIYQSDVIYQNWTQWHHPAQLGTSSECEGKRNLADINHVFI